MKKAKLLTLLLALPLLGGCGHEHTFATEWSFNDAIHYHKATCEHTDLKSDEGSHSFVNGFCSVCGYQQPHVHTFSETWSNDEDKHWHDSTCGHDVISDEGEHTFVNGVCSECGYEKGLPPHVHTFSDDWTSDESGHWHAATCEHTDLKTEFDEHTFEDGNCTVCGFSDPNYQVWTDAEKQIFKDHLYGFELPCVKGLKAEWDADNACVLVYGAAVTHDSFNVYVNTVVAQGFEKQDGPYEDTYILLKDVIVDGKKRTIDIDIFIDDNSNLYAICYDPYIYEWPTDVVDDLYENYFYIAPTVKIPSIAADRYYADTSFMSSDALLTINCYSDVDLTQSYKDALIQKGFIVKDFAEVPGAYVGTDPQEISKVNFVYSSEEKVFTIILSPSEDGWPSLVVDYYTDQLTGNSGTRVPALTGADSYEFIDVYDRYGYFFVLNECSSDLTKSYETLLDEHYTLYNESKNAAGNYWAISDKNDLLVQYVYIVTESQFGGEDYKHFDVLFEKYFPRNEEHITAGLQTIQPDTETTLPAYPGYGEKIDFSSTNKYMTVTIQASTFDSMAQYMNILEAADWSVKDLESSMYNYEAISPNRDIRLESSILDGRMTLTLSAYENPYTNWPIDGINEILTDLDLEGEVPVFEGAFGYDYENSEFFHDIVCIVKPNTEEELVNNYINKLKNLGWKYVDDGESQYYVKVGSDVGLIPYFESNGSGYAYIEIIHGDGAEFDIDARVLFVDWKKYFDIKSSVQIPGIKLNYNFKSYEFYLDEGKTYENNYLFRLNIELTNDKIAEAISVINTTFENDGWVYSSDDGYYHKEDMWLNVHEIEGKIALDICSPIPMNNLETLVKRFVFDEELTEWVTIPENFNIEDEYELVVSKYDVDYVIVNSTLTFDSYDAALAAKTAILNAFKSESWIQPGSNPDELQDDKWMPSLKVVLSLDNDSNELKFSIVSPY